MDLRFTEKTCLLWCEILLLTDQIFAIQRDTIKNDRRHESSAYLRSGATFPDKIFNDEIGCRVLHEASCSWRNISGVTTLMVPSCWFLIIPMTDSIFDFSRDFLVILDHRTFLLPLVTCLFPNFFIKDDLSIDSLSESWILQRFADRLFLAGSECLNTL